MRVSEEGSTQTSLGGNPAEPRSFEDGSTHRSDAGGSVHAPTRKSLSGSQTTPAESVGFSEKDNEEKEKNASLDELESTDSL